MKKIKKFIYLLTLVVPAIVLMAFNPFVNKSNLSNENNKLLQKTPPTPTNIYVSWKTVDVTYRTSGNYVIQYSDMVSSDDPATLMWGCGYLDIDKPTPGWQCNVTKELYTASGTTGCEYIYVHSLIAPTTPEQPVYHTIDVKVRDSRGVESNWGGITLIIHYSSTPDPTEDANPCAAF